MHSYPVQKEIEYVERCYVERKDEESAIVNTLWDGMGLIDDSIFPDDMDGFIYCRSHFFKSCLFRVTYSNTLKIITATNLTMPL